MLKLHQQFMVYWLDMDEEKSIETLKTSKKAHPSSTLTLQKAIELGEYDPKFLSGFAEWHNLSRHSQFQLVRQALDNRERQLRVQWAVINNMLDFSKKPDLHEALRNVEDQQRRLLKDKEKLYYEYSKV